MNKYIDTIKKYFGLSTDFMVEAETKSEARIKIFERAKLSDEYKLDTLRIKKVNKF